MIRITAPLLVFCLLGIAVSAPTARANEPVMCTMEVKLCPDGTYVSRTGPNCEFAPCPGEGGQTQPAPIPVPPPDRMGEPLPGGVPGGTPGFAPGNPGPDNSGEE